MTYPQIAAALGVINILAAIAFGKWQAALIGVVILLVVYWDGREA